MASLEEREPGALGVQAAVVLASWEEREEAEAAAAADDGCARAVGEHALQQR